MRDGSRRRHGSAILDAAAGLGYVPNTVARSLKTQRTHSIGFIGSGLASYVLTPLMRGVEQEATAQGYFTVFTLASGDGEHAEGLVRQLLQRRVDGIVSAALAHQHHQPLTDLLQRATPSVTAFTDLGPEIPLATDDGRRTGDLVGGHLLKLGHRRMAAIAGTSAGPGHPRIARLDAFARAIGVLDDTAWWDRAVGTGDWSAAGGSAAMATLLDRDPRITAVFALNDAMAIGAIHTLRARGLRVPDDVSVVGCDDLPEAAFTVPPLTTVRISFEAIGADRHPPPPRPHQRSGGGGGGPRDPASRAGRPRLDRPQPNRRRLTTEELGYLAGRRRAETTSPFSPTPSMAAPGTALPAAIAL